MIANALRSRELRQYLAKATVLEQPTTSINGTRPEIYMDKVNSRQMDHDIVCGIKYVMAERLLDYLILGALQGLLSSVEFDDIIRNAASQMQQSKEQGQGAMDHNMPSVQLEMYSMQLDGTLVGILEGLIKTGQFDDDLLIAVTNVLQSGSLDEILLEVIVELHSKVRTHYTTLQCITLFMLQTFWKNMHIRVYTNIYVYVCVW